ncbi:peptidylprolyl isomerase [Mesorhizobium sp. ORS 3428]|uniref:peptidylprolyl isomerase n=1 Tax=Mesorhizobium sp. ORS 3428 TaxID=540997 RepID=UPI001FCD73B5|nr:peptidylprolyl isomerase [Mesorhizobium sp. ORS 3428]
MIITLKDGDVTIALRPDLAPKHVAQIKKLVREGAYDNVAFHRVIDGFMAQTGDVKFGNMKKGFNPEAVGTGGSDLPDLPAEFSKTEQFTRGVVGMARSQDPNSANSQFFIMFAPAPNLDGQYTIVGKVVSGMELVDKIKKGDEADNGTVTDPDRMIKVRIAADSK